MNCNTLDEVELGVRTQVASGRTRMNRENEKINERIRKETRVTNSSQIEALLEHFWERGDGLFLQVSRVAEQSEGIRDRWKNK